MAKRNFLTKLKHLFVEEVKPKKYNLKSLDEIDNKREDKEKQIEEINQKVKQLIEDIISGKNQKKEDIIKALNQCEEIYFDKEKQLEIFSSIGKLQNDPEIINEFIKTTTKYSRFEDEKHQKIKEKRKEAIKTKNKLKFEELLKSNKNEYNNKKNIIKVLNLIKNEQLKFEDKNQLKTNIIKIFNNINEELYDDIEVLQALFQVLDNKMRSIKTKEIDKLAKDIKRKIDIYYNVPGTIEEKIIAIRQIPIKKITETPNEIELKSEQEINVLSNKKYSKNPILNSQKYTLIDYNSILESQEQRIKNAKDISEEEKQKMIEELYKNFEEFVGDTNNNSKTR